VRSTTGRKAPYIAPCGEGKDHRSPNPRREPTLARPPAFPLTDARRDRVLKVALSASEHAVLTARAEAAQRSVAEYVRLSLLVEPKAKAR
jgi:hypothetical protein